MRGGGRQDHIITAVMWALPESERGAERARRLTRTPPPQHPPLPDPTPLGGPHAYATDMWVPHTHGPTCHVSRVGGIRVPMVQGQRSIKMAMHWHVVG